jgi:lysozyme family protein
MSTVTPIGISLVRPVDRAIAYAMRWEGGFSDDPRDPGGATNYGISLRFLLADNKIERYDFDGDGDVDANDVRQMTREQAAAVYRERFWWPALNGIPERLAIKAFDFGVNMGPGQSTRLLQRALNDYAAITKSPALYVDGVFGPATSGAIAKVESSVAGLLLADFEELAGRFYFDLAEKRRSARDYFFGWMRRCYARPEL